MNGETLIVKSADYINWAFWPAPLLINIRVFINRGALVEFSRATDWPVGGLSP